MARVKHCPDPDMETFNLFWTAYPRKVAKKKALEAWAKLDPSPALVQKIIRAIGQQRESRQWTEDSGRYIPHPTTWLNQARWEDEVDAPGPFTPQGQKNVDAARAWLAQYGGGIDAKRLEPGHPSLP